MDSLEQAITAAIINWQPQQPPNIMDLLEQAITAAILNWQP